jgi:hypothetical protein
VERALADYLPRYGIALAQAIVEASPLHTKWGSRAVCGAFSDSLGAWRRGSRSKSKIEKIPNDQTHLFGRESILPKGSRLAQERGGPLTASANVLYYTRPKFQLPEIVGDV